MTEDKIIHFEELYEKSEQISSNIHKNTTTEDLIKLITNLLADYKDINLSTITDEVKNSLKNRYMGEVVFLLTAISVRDNINVYAALKQEMNLNETK